MSDPCTDELNRLRSDNKLKIISLMIHEKINTPCSSRPDDWRRFLL